MDPMASVIPYVIESKNGRERVYDIFSRLQKDRIIFLGGGINSQVSNVVTAQLLFLGLQSDKPIQIYINSPGGSITDGMAIYDTMKYLPNIVETYVVGMAASMGAILLSAGTPGHRYALPHSQVMIHQPWGGTQGTASDITIQAENILKWKKELIKILAETAGKTTAQVEKDTDRDKYLTAYEAKEYGLIDHVIEKATAKAKAAEEDNGDDDEDEKE